MPVSVIEILFLVFFVCDVKRRVWSGVVKECVVNPPECMGIIVRVGSFPNDLIREVVATEDFIQDGLDIVHHVPVQVNEDASVLRQQFF